MNTLDKDHREMSVDDIDYDERDREETGEPKPALSDTKNLRLTWTNL